MIRREVDATLFNRIANDPQVRPYFDLAGTGHLDFTECVARPSDYVLLSDGEACASLLEWSAPGVWECHTFFLPEARGGRAIEAAQAMCVWMFDFGADLLWGQTPTILRHARWFNRKVGFTSAGIGFHHACGEVERFVLRKSDGRTSCSIGSDHGRRQPISGNYGRQRREEGC